MSRHQRMLLNMFPYLNPYSVKLILSRVTLLQFLSLDKSSISTLFPWLPETAAAHIADTTSTTFQLSQFVNYEKVGHSVTNFMDRTIREVDKIMKGLKKTTLFVK